MSFLQGSCVLDDKARTSMNPMESVNRPSELVDSKLRQQCCRRIIQFRESPRTYLSAGRVRYLARAGNGG